MTIENIEELESFFEGFENNVERKERKYLHPKSVKNFFIYFEKLSPKSKPIVRELLVDYCEALRLNGINLSKDTSFSFGMTYIMSVGAIYERELSFKTLMDWSFILFWGLIFDGCLFLLGLSKFYFQVPICVFVLSIRKIYYLKIEKNGKVYGLFY